MVTTEGRFDRNERFFGPEGQAKIAATRLAIVGNGGLGSIFTQQAAYLGFRSFGLVDADIVTGSSLNRLVGAVLADVGLSSKVDVALRVIRSVDPDAEVDVVRKWLTDSEARRVITGADIVIGCLDDDAARLELTEITTTARLPYLDLASEISVDGDAYGGRVVFAEPGRRCVYCLGELDSEELALSGLSPEQRRARDTSYGLSKAAMGRRGAAVVSVNGVVASLGLTELMVYVTGLRPPAITLTYRGDVGVVRRRTNEPSGPCPYCGRD